MVRYFAVVHEVDASQLSSAIFQTIEADDLGEEPGMARWSFGNADAALLHEAEMDRLHEGEESSEVDDPTLIGNNDEDRMFSPEVSMEVREKVRSTPEMKKLSLSIPEKPANSSRYSNSQ